MSGRGDQLELESIKASLELVKLTLNLSLAFFVSFVGFLIAPATSAVLHQKIDRLFIIAVLASLGLAFILSILSFMLIIIPLRRGDDPLEATSFLAVFSASILFLILGATFEGYCLYFSVF